MALSWEQLWNQTPSLSSLLSEMGSALSRVAVAAPLSRTGSQPSVLRDPFDDPAMYQWCPHEGCSRCKAMCPGLCMHCVTVCFDYCLQGKSSRTGKRSRSTSKILRGHACSNLCFQLVQIGDHVAQRWSQSQRCCMQCAVPRGRQRVGLV